ncbi:helix-turn-helix domain-containing protein [uncultured Oscillibacter sp.]|jgi:excisionase family DNA binding protein|uniref:helix-turn-helix domain-containing protein n=1 Tax=uncultured Oscillibacter sp. TaxID=876091 RepID=UPI00217088DF|nr:helix-turn-helix domain-containing protein [uncultured Oscillibacter sp.]MCI9288794.1 helix-turn-helix domain-containing protein [Oscillospiraceae bacterium]
MKKKFERVTNPESLSMVLTPLDIAAVLGISRNTAYELVHSKDFPAFRVGKQYRVSKTRFLAWLDGENAA